MTTTSRTDVGGDGLSGSTTQPTPFTRGTSSGSSSARSTSSTDTSITSVSSNSRLLNLPLELQFQIVEYMTPDNFIHFSIAHYAHLRREWIEHLPPITPEIYMNIVSAQPPQLGPMRDLAPELVLLIMQRLPRKDLMAFALANYKLLQSKGIVGELAEEDVKQLRMAMDLPYG